MHCYCEQQYYLEKDDIIFTPFSEFKTVDWNLYNKAEKKIKDPLRHAKEVLLLITENRSTKEFESVD